MSNLVFPKLPGLIYPVKKTPIWSNDTRTSVSGVDTVIANWTYPRWDWSLSFELLRDNPQLDELWSLIGFFNLHMGSFDSWLFEDPDDSIAINEPFGVGDGTQTIFPLVRSRGGFVEPITDVKPYTLEVAVGGSPAYVGTISYQNGYVTFSNPPSTGRTLNWSGIYYWRCRFKEDTVEFSKFANRLWETGDIPFRSIKA